MLVGFGSWAGCVVKIYFCVFASLTVSFGFSEIEGLTSYFGSYLFSFSFEASYLFSTF